MHSRGRSSMQTSRSPTALLKGTERICCNSRFDDLALPVRFSAAAGCLDLLGGGLGPCLCG
eukprot:587450-Heterocapsa_arctica.AAC.1